MKILFYGPLGDVVGREMQIELPSQNCTVEELRKTLAELHPAATEGLMKTSLRACVGDEIVQDDFCLAGADTVEFFPPVSGG